MDLNTAFPSSTQSVNPSKSKECKIQEDQEVDDVEEVREENGPILKGKRNECKIQEEHEVDDEEEVNWNSNARGKGERTRAWFSNQFMVPEWMVDVPPCIKQEWFVMPRPAGKRCLVITSRGTTISRLWNGRVLHSFPSALPNGAKHKNHYGPRHMSCVVDCIFHEPDQTYYAIDMLTWQGYDYSGCTAEFRFFWLKSKFAETNACDPPSRNNKYQFSIVPVYDCDRSGLEAAYSGYVPFYRDGCLFFNKNAHYETGLTPLNLVWKDSKCSQHFLDSDRNGNVGQCQQIFLKVQKDGISAGTIDNPPVILATLPQQNLKPGTVVRFSLADGGIEIVHGKPRVVADLQFEGFARDRAVADSWSKISFQHAARCSPLTIQDLMVAVDSSDFEDFEGKLEDFEQKLEDFEKRLKNFEDKLEDLKMIGKQLDHYKQQRTERSLFMRSLQDYQSEIS